jgi:large subunit ribosomal protein L44e
MKVPGNIKTYCPNCDTHPEHRVLLYKAGIRKGAKLGERRQAERKKGYGGQKFPQQRNQAKTTRKQTLKFECTECGYILQTEGIRMKKLEIA